MTRINLIPVEELSDQHLLAEYRELPRIVNAVINCKAKNNDIPRNYRLGQGHVRFFYNKIIFLFNRYSQIYDELKYRGFIENTPFSPEQMGKSIHASLYNSEKYYEFSEEEIALSRDRILEKLKQKPNWYKWTKRQCPNYLA